MVEVLVPQSRHSAYVVFRHSFGTGGAVDQPGDGGGVAQVGGQFAVRVVEKLPLAGEAAHLGGQRRVVDQVLIPDLPMCVWLDLVDAEPVAPSLLEVKTQLGLLRGGAQQQVFHSRRPGPQVLEGRTNDHQPQFVQTDTHKCVTFFRVFPNL